ncbi:hypothetical protein [Paraburkholderia solisilvae]|uniref:hypothetical protein n=1 Tax=Paraburkholderia solisilvae TaxID=624376 RepID=UPI0035E768D2
MSERERQVNLRLNELDDAHRLGHMARDEYRLRRRRLLASLGDDTRKAGRDTVRRPAPAGDAATLAATRPRERGTGAEGAPPARVPASVLPLSRWRQLALPLSMLGAAVGVALFYWFVLRAM